MESNVLLVPAMSANSGPANAPRPCSKARAIYEIEGCSPQAIFASRGPSAQLRAATFYGKLCIGRLEPSGKACAPLPHDRGIICSVASWKDGESAEIAKDSPARPGAVQCSPRGERPV